MARADGSPCVAAGGVRGGAADVSAASVVVALTAPPTPLPSQTRPAPRLVACALGVVLTTPNRHPPGAGLPAATRHPLMRRCSTLARRSVAQSGETPRGMSVRVRDLEIALVLAREMKAAAARSVEASLRLDQLQEVFGVERLDRAERARIQTALQMAGLEPFPSLLEADPTEPIRFGASQAAVTAEREIPAEPEEPAAAEAPAPTFPTVGEFARSKLRGRSGRRFGLRRGDHGDDDAPPPPPPPLEDSNGRLPELDGDATRAHEVLPEEEEVPVDYGPEVVEDATAVHAVPEEEPHDEPVDDHDATAIHTVPEGDEPEVHADATAMHAIPDDAEAQEAPDLGEPAVDEPEVEDRHEETEIEDHLDEPAVEDHHDEPEVEEPATEDRLAESELEDRHEEPEVEDHREDPAVEDHHDEPEVEDHLEGPEAEDHL